MMANYTHTFFPIFDFYDVQHAFWYALLYAYAVFADWLCVMILIIIGPARQPNQSRGKSGKYLTHVNQGNYEEVISYLYAP